MHAHRSFKEARSRVGGSESRRQILAPEFDVISDQ